MRIAEDVRAVWAQSWVTPWVWPLIIAYNVSLGTVLILGGDDRINGPSFAVIRMIGNEAAGSVFLVGGLAIWAAAFVSRQTLNRAGVLAAIAHLFLAAGFLAALLSEPPAVTPGTVRAALTGVPTYLFVAAVHFANAFVYGQRGPLGERGGSA